MQKPYPSETQERFIVRLPDGMRDRIAEAAKANNRSMNSEITLRLQSSFDAPAMASQGHTIPDALYGYVLEFAQKHKVSQEEALVRMLAGAADGVGGSDVVLIVPRPGMSLEEMRAVMDMARLEVPRDAHVIYDSRLEAALPVASFEGARGLRTPDPDAPPPATRTIDVKVRGKTVKIGEDEEPFKARVARDPAETTPKRAAKNKVILIGNLGRDPELRTFPSGDRVSGVDIGKSQLAPAPQSNKPKGPVKSSNARKPKG